MERSLDTVAHFFLSDRDVREDLQGDVGPDKGSAEKDEGNTIPGTQSEVCFVLCPDGFTPQASLLGCMIAFSLAASDIPVGLIETTTRLPHTFFLSGGYEKLDAVFWEADLDSPDFMNMVARFRKTNNYVLINTTASALMKTDDPLGLKGRWLVPAAVQPQNLLSAYRTVKNASKKEAMAEIELVVIKQRSKDNVRGAATVLKKMAHKFLPCSVRYIGSVSLAEDTDAPIAISSTPLPRPRSDVAMTAVKEITRHLIVSAGLQKKRKAHVEKRL